VWQRFEKIGAETAEKECLEIKRKLSVKHNGRSSVIQTATITNLYLEDGQGMTRVVQKLPAH